MSDTPIYVTQPFLAPLEEFSTYLEQIWQNKIITNSGQFHQQLESALCEFLGVKYISLFNNGTIALITALKALKINGEVITTPYSFVATAHSLLWNGIEPVFIDIDPSKLNLDPNKIEAAISPRTTAIMPVHCYGNPCDVDAIQAIAAKHGLKVIYDAAHAFGVKCHCGSVLNHGDLSVLSFHATKVFNTFEGGAIVCPDAETKHHIDQLKNFGFVDELTVEVTGINGKMSEINSAFGLVQLRYIQTALNERMKVDEMYRTHLMDVKGIKIVEGSGQIASNFSYFPILVGADYPLTRDELYQKLKENNIFVRRYFYPLISEFPMYKNLQSSRVENLPVALKASHEILCLPIYPGISLEDQMRIISLIKDGNS